MEKIIEHHLVEINSKIKKLKARTIRLEAENEELRKSVFEYLQQIETQKKESEKIAQTLQHYRISDSIQSDKKILQKEIDKYVLMIDKCIAAVNTKM
ncbi:MAG TPA: hypothetical protein PLU17_05970 [Chitinophagaceae bacterium]|jgi:replicative DNA helicase|nr:hypothetical protein [Chitinophagaceae bacterium]